MFSDFPRALKVVVVVVVFFKRVPVVKVNIVRFEREVTGVVIDRVRPEPKRESLPTEEEE